MYLLDVHVLLCSKASLFNCLGGNVKHIMSVPNSDFRHNVFFRYVTNVVC